MADQKITELTAVVTPALADLLAAVNGGSTKKITLEQVRDFVQANIESNTLALTTLTNIATSRILGRVTAGSGEVEALTPAQAISVIFAALSESGNAYVIAEQSTLNVTGSSLTVDFETAGNNPVIDFVSHSGAVTINFTNGENGQSGFIRIIKGANSVTPTFQYDGVAGDFLFADGESFDASELTDDQEQLIGYFISGGDLFVTGLSGIYK